MPCRNLSNAAAMTMTRPPHNWRRSLGLIVLLVTVYQHPPSRNWFAAAPDRLGYWYIAIQSPIHAPAPAMNALPQISVAAFADRLAQGETLQLVDVREPDELATAQLPGFINLPLSQAEDWSPNIQAHLDPTKETLVLCHHGMRSAQMTGWLLQQGFQDVKNITGGIDAYAATVDRSIPRY
jgi:rhodanese-related sulfurtransferase